MKEVSQASSHQNQKVSQLVSYQYEVRGKTGCNQEISQSGVSQFINCIDRDDFYDEGLIFGRAFNLVMEHFSTSGLEQQEYSYLTEVTISIKNLKVEPQ